MQRTLLTLLVASSITACGGATAAASLTDADFRRIALERVPGTVEEIEREESEGVSIAEVSVRANDGTRTSVEIDARSGEILEVESEAEEAREAATEPGDEDQDGETDEHVGTQP